MKVCDLLERGRGAAIAGIPIEYKLGAGGMHPGSPIPGASCDCSGFVSWCLGVSRQTDHPLYQRINGGWINTDAMVADIGDAAGLFRSCEPEPGAVVVYPGPPARAVGHCGIVVATEDGRATQVLHCSSGNWRQHGHAIRITGPGVFDRQADAVYGWFTGVDRPMGELTPIIDHDVLLDVPRESGPQLALADLVDVQGIQPAIEERLDGMTRPRRVRTTWGRLGRILRRFWR